MRIIAIVLTMLLATPAWAAPGDIAGRWAVRSNGRVLMAITLAKTNAGWRGTWRRPLHFQSDDSWQALVRVEGPIIDRPLVAATAVTNGVRLDFVGARSGERDSMTFSARPDGTARIAWTGGPPGAMLVLDRAAPAEMPIRPDPAARYAVDQHWPTNAEMAAIFDADQGDRADMAKMTWSVIGPRDQARAARTRALLDSGALASGDDFYHAAFVFQHGLEPNDYLLAHSLAIIAVARGRDDATWIAAATLDRYLQRIGQKQVFGTQFGWRDGSPVTQEPFDRTLLSDAVRRATGVPPLADQEKRRQQFERDRPSAKNERTTGTSHAAGTFLRRLNERLSVWTTGSLVRKVVSGSPAAPVATGLTRFWSYYGHLSQRIAALGERTGRLVHRDGADRSVIRGDRPGARGGQ